MGGFVKAVFDPAGVLGNWEDTPGGPAPQPEANPGYGMLGTGRLHDFQSQLNDIGEKARNGQRMKGFMESMGASSDPRVDQLNQVWEKDAQVKPSDWSAQWSYAPGKGPQWIEPKRVSGDNSVPYAAVVNNGPAKGNRF